MKVTWDNVTMKVLEVSKFDIHKMGRDSLSSYFNTPVQDCVTDNLRSARLCDPAENVMP